MIHGNTKVIFMFGINPDQSRDDMETLIHFATEAGMV